MKVMTLAPLLCGILHHMNHSKSLQRSVFPLLMNWAERKLVRQKARLAPVLHFSSANMS